MTQLEKALINYLQQYRGYMSKQEYRTFKGQILSGHGREAIKGIRNLMRKRIGDDWETEGVN